MELFKNRLRAVGLALALMIAAPSAQSALMTETSGGVFTAINGFEFGGTTYNISFTETLWDGITGIRFNKTDADNFVGSLALALNSLDPKVNADFTLSTGINPRTGVEYALTHALVPLITEEHFYLSYLQTNGSGFFKKHGYSALEGSANAWNFNVSNTSHTDFTGMNISAVTAVPLPGAIYLFGAGLLGLLAYRRTNAEV